MKKALFFILALVFASLVVTACDTSPSYSGGSGSGFRVSRTADLDDWFKVSTTDAGWSAICTKYIPKDDNKLIVATVTYGLDVLYDRGRSGDILSVGLLYNSSEGAFFTTAWSNYDRLARGSLSLDDFYGLVKITPVTLD